MLPDAYEDTGRRGRYFAKSGYTPEALPTFESARGLLPVPIADDHPEYIRMYWKAWELAFRGLKQPLAGSPFVSNYVDEGFSDCVFQWDTIFMLLFMRYAHAAFPAIASLDNFYARQYENGYICRQLRETDGEDRIFKERADTINPPLFAWAEIGHYRITGDASRFALVLPALEKHAEWLEAHRRRQNTTHGLYWNSPLGSGMDNIPLEGSGWVCMSSQMVLFYRQMAFMREHLGETASAHAHAERADEIAERIQKFMWFADDGFYYNILDDGTPHRVKAVAGFWPLLAGVADKQQARWLLFHLRDAKKFWRPMPVPSVAANEPTYICDGGYWLGGVWAPTNLMIVKGLEPYGPETASANIFSFNEIATVLAGRYLDGLAKEFRRTGTFWESYSAELVTRGNPAKGDFVGWTGAGPIQLLIENILGFRPDAPARRLVWRLQRIDRHGIENLRFGDISASLLCHPRESVLAAADIEVTSDKPFTLAVDANDGAVREIEVKPGTYSHRVGR